MKSSSICRHHIFQKHVCQKNKVGLTLPVSVFVALCFCHFFPRNWEIRSQRSVVLDLPVLYGGKNEKCRSGGWAYLANEALHCKWSFFAGFLISVNVSWRGELRTLSQLIRTYSQVLCYFLKTVLLTRFVSISFVITSFPPRSSPSQGECYSE